MGQLRDRMEEDLRLRGYLPCTRQEYLRSARRFVAHFMRSPERMDARLLRQVAQPWPEVAPC